MLNINSAFRGSLFLLVLLISIVGLAHAQEEEGEEVSSEASAPATNPDGTPATPQAIYLPLKPPIVVNYGGVGRLRYLKTDISIRVKNTDAAHAVRYHMPYVRNNLIMLFAAQTNESVSSQEGREGIRAAALSEVRGLLERESGTPPDDIVDLYFNNFLVQK